MGTLINNKIAIILIYINLLFILRVVEVCYCIKDVNYGLVTILFVVGTIIFMFYNSVLKRFIFKLLFTLIILISLVVIYLFKSKLIQAIISNWIKGDLSVMSNSIYESTPTYFYQYKIIIIIVIPLLIFLFISLAVKTWGNSIIFLSLGVMINFWYLGYSKTIKLYLFKCLFLTIITYYCNVYINHKRLLNKRGIKAPKENRVNLIYIFVVIFCISLLITIMPQEAKGKYDSNFFTKWTNDYSENKKIKDLPGIKLKYDISLSGYGSGDKKLGGPISIDYTLVLKVKSDKPYYLKGTVKDFYNGHSWTRAESTYIKNKSNSERVFNDNFSFPYLEGDNSVTIYPESMKTSTFFTPNYTYNVDAGNSSVFHDNIPTFLCNDFITKSYNANFYNQKANTDVTPEKYFNSGKYLPFGYEKYLQLPENLSTDIYARVDSITKGCTTDFEKVQKIKEYLSKNYKYSLKVSEVPKDKEFLDYFLNVEKQGYCTYFATATTVFCRIAGVPARYVEGYNMTNEKDSKGLFMVTNENAHAWTEVLLLSSKEAGIWYTLDSVPNAAEEIEKIKKAEQIIIEGETGKSTSLDPKNKSNIKNNLMDNNPGSLNRKKLSKAYIISIIASLVIVFLIMIRHIMFAFKKMRILKSKSLIPLYNNSLKRLEKVGIIKSPTDTDKEFALKIKDSKLKDTMINITLLCYSEFYGNKVVEGFDKVKYYKFIEKYIQNKQNIIKYCIIKYIL